MDPTTQRLMFAGTEPVATTPGPELEELFAVTLWSGNSTLNRPMTTGVDLLNNGGMFFVTRYNVTTTGQYLTYKNDRSYMRFNNDQEERIDSNIGSGFTSDGVLLGSAGAINAIGDDNIGITWRKEPKFFDVVTYSGNGSNRTISHNLDAIPRMIWIKATGPADDEWICGAEALGWDKYMNMIGNTSTTGAPVTTSVMFNDTAPTDSVFTVGTDSAVNGSGQDFVALIWAGGPDTAVFTASGNKQILKIDSYSGDGTTSHAINCGFEPQHVIIRPMANGYWLRYEEERSVDVGGWGQTTTFGSGTTTASTSYQIDMTSTGFTLQNSHANINASGTDYLYLAVSVPTGP